MPEIDFSSKDYARLKYHMDNSVEKAELLKYKEFYQMILKELEYTSLAIREEQLVTIDIDTNPEDEKLRWKLELIQEAKHQEEIDAKEDEEEED